MILLAFVILAIYLLILGAINRRQHPLMVYGPWDFAGVLFAASGFLLFGGPEARECSQRQLAPFPSLRRQPFQCDIGHREPLALVAHFVDHLFRAGRGRLRLFPLVLCNQTSIYNVDQGTIENGAGAHF